MAQPSRHDVIATPPFTVEDKNIAGSMSVMGYRLLFSAPAACINEKQAIATGLIFWIKKLDDVDWTCYVSHDERFFVFFEMKTGLLGVQDLTHSCRSLYSTCPEIEIEGPIYWNNYFRRAWVHFREHFDV